MSWKTSENTFTFEYGYVYAKQDKECDIEQQSLNTLVIIIINSIFICEKMQIFPQKFAIHI